VEEFQNLVLEVVCLGSWFQNLIILKSFVFDFFKSVWIGSHQSCTPKWDLVGSNFKNSWGSCQSGISILLLPKWFSLTWEMLSYTPVPKFLFLFWMHIRSLPGVRLHVTPPNCLSVALWGIFNKTHKGHRRKTPSGMHFTKTKPIPLLDNSDDALEFDHQYQTLPCLIKKEKTIFFRVLDMDQERENHLLPCTWHGGWSHAEDLDGSARQVPKEIKQGQSVHHGTHREW
jgi:hypothetical protein